MRTIDEAQVRAVLRYDTLIPAMAEALTHLATGRASQPVRTILPIPEHAGLFGVMPAIYGDIIGAKLVTVYAANAERGLPSHQATIQIFRSSTGEPLATLDGRLITEMRTAAVSALAVNVLAPHDAHTLAILGSGVQARAHAAALRTVRPFDTIRVWSRNAAHAARCATEIGAIPAPTAEAAVRDADVVITVTNSPTPILLGTWLRDAACVVAVGAIGPTRRELDPNALRGSVIVDSREAALQESGDILLAHAPIYAELGELLTGAIPYPTRGPVVFESLGLAVEDLAAARLVYESLL
jgi:ornithine cyclodeaminase/alanine dehydrogenase-like protein (mu-crystallin family)